MDVNKQIILTLEKKIEFEEELKRLEGEERETIRQAIKDARDLGDLSENSEYDDAMERQAANESRIMSLHQMLLNCVVVEAPKKGGRISIGHVVTVAGADGKERVYTIVGTAEADPLNNKISNESPMGMALMDHKKGDEVSFKSPSGKILTYKIISVEAR